MTDNNKTITMMLQEINDLRSELEKAKSSNDILFNANKYLDEANRQLHTRNYELEEKLSNQNISFTKESLYEDLCDHESPSIKDIYPRFKSVISEAFDDLKHMGIDDLSRQYVTLHTKLFITNELLQNTCTDDDYNNFF